MRNPYVNISLLAAALLLIGSGCETSDMLTVAEILGGSQGVTTTDVLQHGLTGSTDDPGKDALIKTADTMDSVRKANDLQGDALEAVTKKTPDYDEALVDLKKAEKLRPRDETIIYQRDAVRAERNNGEEIKPLVSPYLWCNVTSDDIAEAGGRNKRCFRSMIKDRGMYLDESIERQKARGSLVSCATYAQVFETYDWVARMAPSDAQKMGLSDTDYDRYVARSEQAKAIIAHPGQSCAQAKPPA